MDFIFEILIEIIMTPIIEGYAFADSTSLKTLIIPSTVGKIYNAFCCDCTSLTSFCFEGTIDQWNSIEKNSIWHAYTNDYTIYCTDGEITKDGTITYYEKALN